MNCKVTVRLLPISDKVRLAIDGGASDFENLSGLRLVDPALVRDVVAQTLAMDGYAAREMPWVGYLAAADNAVEVIGTCAFVGSPDASGSVEIAYYTFPPFEGRGYATAMARHECAILRLPRTR